MNDPSGISIPRVLRANGGCFPPQFVTQRCVFPKPLKTAHEACAVPGLEEQACIPVLEDFRHLPYSARDHRPAGGHVFKELERRVVELVETRIWCDSDIHRGQILRHILMSDSPG